MSVVIFVFFLIGFFDFVVVVCGLGGGIDFLVDVDVYGFWIFNDIGVGVCDDVIDWGLGMVYNMVGNMMLNNLIELGLVVYVMSGNGLVEGVVVVDNSNIMNGCMGVFVNLFFIDCVGLGCIYLVVFCFYLMEGLMNF